MSRLVDKKVDNPTYEEYIRYFNQRTEKYFPPRDDWTPVDDALFTPDDLYRIPIDKAKQMQLAAIQFAFNHHYRNNEFYRNFCNKNNVSPEDIKTSEDITRIPLIPDVFFKNYPDGRQFATWLGNLCTGELPDIIIKSRHPGKDHIIDAFNTAGMAVTYSSGTGGKHTFIPRDYRSFCNMQYSLAKSILGMSCGRWIYESETYFMMPDPRLNSLFAGKSSEIMFDIVETAHVAIDQKLTLKHLSLIMNNHSGIRGKIARYLSLYKYRRIIDNFIEWLIKREQSPEFTFILGAPYLIHAAMQRLKHQGRSFNFGERGGVVTGGGWKIYENERLPVSTFRDEVYEILGIPGQYCLDVYGMVESNGWMVQCPEGHYLHVPYSFFKPLILNDALQPVQPGQWGRFAFLDASALSYPGFILTGDQARMLERCPVCNRPGPVLEPEIKRAYGQDDRGCAIEVRRMFTTGQST